jgi:single-stranded-DNA-specific exonuclease
MQSRPSRWECDPYEVDAALRLADGLGVSHPVAALLARRGFDGPDEARAFLAAHRRHDPLTLPGAPDALAAIRAHVERGSRIVVFGDYDVDGVCATAIMLRTLRALGADPSWELPSRFGDGYGLSSGAVERMAAAGAELLITVDCAITAVDEVAAARRAGLEVIVTDHHRPGDELPDCTVVHPAIGGYGCPELCASGVALKLAEGLRGEAAADDLDLAALATVCDLVPLRDENRRIVKAGLVELSRTRKPGLRALMEVASIEPGAIDEHALGFRLGPRINAAGRMQRADAALELMMTDSPERAAEIAGELDLLNLDRREAETRILFAADAACAAQADRAALVVAGEDWHPGVVGIVASRLVERWRRPCVVIALDGDAGRGSGRSIGPYDLHAGLQACAPHLLRFGGHRAAAGLDIARDRIDDFRRALADHAGGLLAPEDLMPAERVDAVVPGGSLGLPLAEELESLRPFGMGNPQPTLLVPAARVEAVAGMGKDRQHARFTVVTAGSRSRGVAFGSPPRSIAGPDAGPHDLALRLELNRWNGTVEPRVVMRAMCPTRPGTLRVLGEDGGFWERLEATLATNEPADAQPAADRPPRPAANSPRDRRGEGFAGVAGDLLSSGEPVLVAVADVSRRRESLATLVAGLAPEGLPVASWSALRRDPGLAAPFAHLVALDPPPGGATDPLLAAGPLAHLAWGPAEVEFALAAYRWELDLRPALAAAYRALRDLQPGAPPDALEAALRGPGDHPRGPEACALLVRVLGELALVEFDGRSARVLDSVRTELDRSPAFRECAERLTAVERALAAELPARRTAVAAAR